MLHDTATVGPGRPHRLDAVADIRVSGVDKVARTGEQPVQLCNYTDVYHNDVIRPLPTLMRATATVREVEKYRLEPGDVVITKDSEDPTDIAVPAYVEESADDLVCGYHLAIIRPGPMVRGRYLKYWFDRPRTRAYFGSRANGATRFGLTIGAIKRCVVGLPELSEQDRAVEALSGWDRAIDLAERRLAIARDRKRGLMQALLTGEIRFPDFEGQRWRKVQLGTMGSTYSGLSGKTKADFGQDGVPYVPYLNVFENSTVDPTNLGRVRAAPGERQNRVQRGDVLFTASSETPEDVGTASVVAHDIPDLCLNSFCFGYRIANEGIVAFEFLPHLFRGPQVRRSLYGLAQGATRYNLSTTHLMSVTLAVPSLPEQRRIAAVLDTADSEIALHLDLVTHLRAQKRSLLEHLLTGKLRLPPRPDNGLDANADPVPTPTTPPP